MRTRTVTACACVALLGLAAAAGACGSDPIASVDTLDAEDSAAVDVLDTVTPDTVAPDTEIPDTVRPDTRDAADTEPTDTLVDPLTEDVIASHVDREDPPPPEPARCLAVDNGDAERAGIDSWRVVAGSFVAQKRTGAFAGNYPPAHGGTWYFRAGDAADSTMEQVIPLGDDAPVAVGSPLTALMSLWLRDYSGDDEAYFALAALGAAGAVLEERVAGPFLDEDWTRHELTLRLPEGTESVRVRLRGVRKKGDSNDAYFDDVAVCLYDGPPRGDIAELYAPPYLMNVTQTAVTVLFETRRALVAAVDYGEAPDALDQTVTDASARTMHELRLTGLAPGARHYYRVRYDDTALPTWDFQTAPPDDSDERVEFVVFADNQDGPEFFTQLKAQMAAFQPQFVLQAGDCVQDGHPVNFREEFLGPLFGLGNHAPIVIGAGNHETYDFAIVTSNEARALWNAYVAQPNDEHCFGFRWGPLFVMVIDTELGHAQGFPQYDECIEKTLQSPLAQTARFRTAIFHRPPLIEYWDSVATFSSPTSFFSAGMDAPDVRAYLAPLFEQYHVQLVFNGHNHLYQRVDAWPRTVTWLISGGGGGGLESGIPESRVNDWSPFVTKQVFGRHHFLHVVIDGDVMAIEAIAMNGEILDTWYTIAR